MPDQDKSKQQLIEELAEMRRREAQWRSVVADAPVFVALADRAGALLEAQEVARLGFYVLDIAQGRWTSSPVLDRIFGIPADYDRTVEGWAKLVHPEERQAVLDHLLKDVVGEKRPCDREYRIVRFGDKQVRWVHGLGRLQFSADGQPVSMLGTIQDITERKQAEEGVQKARAELEQRVKQRTAELAEANEYLDIFRKFVEASGEAIGMTDLDGRIAYANSAVARLFGEERPENMVGKNIAAYYSEEYLRRRKGEMIPCLLRVGHWHVETTISPRVGEPRTISQSTFLIRDEEGNPLRVGVVIRDITEQKQAEEDLRASDRNLKHLLHSSDHERQLIAYEIHDGLAQQLAGALMQLQAFEHLRDKNPKQAAKAYDAGLTMLRQGHFEARRLIAGVRPPILDESGVVEAVAHLVHELCRDKGPKIEYRSRVDFDRLDPTLENAVYRISQEALTNACTHSQSEKISASLVQAGDRLRIEIRDWGIGFDPKTVPKNHFGLEGIRQRARLLGGKCSIRSTLGKGTRIIVELPVMPRYEEA